MALANFSDLKSAVTSWMDRTDVAGNVEEFIALAEAGLNRELQAARTEATLQTVAGDRTVDVSSLVIDQPVALHLDIGSSEVRLSKMDGAQTPRSETSRRPQRWELDGSNIGFDAPSDAVYNLRFEYDERFALSDAAPTNDLLTNHPDLYLSACILWGAGYTQDPQSGADYGTKVRALLPSVRRHYANRRKATLKVDPALRQARR